MKHITLLLCILFTLSAGAQTYNEYYGWHYLNDTLLVQNKKIAPGDTVHLGWGSGNNKQFLFMYFMPTIMNASSSGPEYLPRAYSNQFMILKEIKELKLFGKKYASPVFWIYGKKTLKASGDVINAIAAGELKIE